MFVNLGTVSHTHTHRDNLQAGSSAEAIEFKVHFFMHVLWCVLSARQAPVMDIRTTCTACVGTLLMEYGTLSELTGDPRWRHLAEHAATVSESRHDKACTWCALLAQPSACFIACFCMCVHAFQALFKRRSSLGLVGTSLDVSTSTWVSREATIGPGSDSFYEYMLKVGSAFRRARNTTEQAAFVD